VGVASDEVITADTVVGLDALDHMHRERQPGNPGFAVALVVQVELGRWRVMHRCLGTKVVLHPDEQVWLFLHQREVTHLPASGAWQRRRPDQARGAVAQQIESLY